MCVSIEGWIGGGPATRVRDHEWRVLQRIPVRHESCSCGGVRSRTLIGFLLLAVGCSAAESGPELNGPSKEPSEEAQRPAEPVTSPQPTDPALETGTGNGSGGGTQAKRACSVGFQKDVLPKLAASCGDASCHGEGATAPQIDVTSPADTHAALMDYAFGSLEWSDPHPDYSGAQEPELKKALDAWRLCGAPSE